MSKRMRVEARPPSKKCLIERTLVFLTFEDLFDETKDNRLRNIEGIVRSVYDERAHLVDYIIFGYVVGHIKKMLTQGHFDSTSALRRVFASVSQDFKDPQVRHTYRLPGIGDLRGPGIWQELLTRDATRYVQPNESDVRPVSNSARENALSILNSFDKYTVENFHRVLARVEKKRKADPESEEIILDKERSEIKAAKTLRVYLKEYYIGGAIQCALPIDAENKLLRVIQKLLEVSSFQVIKWLLPNSRLASGGELCRPAQLELSKIWDLVKNERFFVRDQGSLHVLFKRLAVVRHCAVHRNENIPIESLLLMLKDAMAILRIFGDTMRIREARNIRRELACVLEAHDQIYQQTLKLTVYEKSELERMATELEQEYYRLAQDYPAERDTGELSAEQYERLVFRIDEERVHTWEELLEIRKQIRACRERCRDLAETSRRIPTKSLRALGRMVGFRYRRTRYPNFRYRNSYHISSPHRSPYDQTAKQHHTSSESPVKSIRY
ncbi:hypothetical protein B7494_g7242 [Chlorociboria aeruginascens]|nr:hypothetical protein B7494_g7242 [Chlorociboria aeruginascens]